MSFLEDLRRQRALAEEKIFASAEALRIRQEKVRQLEKKPQLNSKEKHRKALEYMNMSDFPRLADELIDAVSFPMWKDKVGLLGVEDYYRGKVFVNPHYGEDGPMEDYYRKAGLIPGAAEYQLGWDVRKVIGDLHSYKYITFRFYHDGVIEVGNQTLAFDEWHQKPDNAEKALGKAFKRPRTKYYKEIPSSSPPRDNWGGGYT